MSDLHAACLLSLLHEAHADNSATRLFRRQPVLTHTLRRLASVHQPLPVAAMKSGAAGDVDTEGDASLPTLVACWDDQLMDVTRAAEDMKGVDVFTLGARRSIPHLEAVAVAQRWADGWRSGPLQTCTFDRGFHAIAALAALERASASQASSSARMAGPPCNAILLIDPAAAFVAPDLLSALLDHAASNPDRDFVFHPTAPGLSGVLLRKPLLEALARSNQHPGRALHYVPDHYAHDPIATPAAAPHPAETARTLSRFTLDDASTIRRFERLTVPMNGSLIRATAPALVRLADADTALSETPRDLRLELTTRSATKAIFRPQSQRGELPLPAWLPLLDALAATVTRVTLAGNGDPMLYPEFPSFLAACAERRIRVAVESDLVGVSPESILAAATSGAVDLLLFHLPATTQATFAKVMGVDALEEHITNLRAFLAARNGLVPIAIPVFTKCRENLAEMEPWYDHWLRTLGNAVIDPATTHAGQIEDHAPVDMSPANRVPCRRLAHRMQILSDGRVAACEFTAEGVTGCVTTGDLTTANVATTNLADHWHNTLAPLRSAHNRVTLHQFTSDLPVACQSCKEWHRP